ncbi:MAG: divergent polysaccharide deacetylase family protein [Pseudodesulfovibrio sp.]
MDERPLEENTQETAGSESFLRKLYRPGPLVFFFAFAIFSLLGLGWHLLTEDTPPPEVVARAAISAANALPKIYEEDTSNTMEDKVRQVDLAIIEAMRRFNLNFGDLELLDVELRRKDGRGYHYQVLRIPAQADTRGFLSELAQRLTAREPEALLSVNGTDEAMVSVAALPTHRLLLRTIPFVLPRPEKAGPKIAIVIDDIGEDMDVLRGLVDLDFPVTLAVWPHASHTVDSVELIQAKERDLIVHFPMEPRGYPDYDPGDDALFVSMSADQIRARVAENLARVPGAVGVNNHMGSRFTENGPGMTEALAEFHKRGLFFLDSLTTARSVGRRTAAAVGIPFYERDIFLDNVKDVSAIIHQLRMAEKVARKQGYSIAIGHPYPATLAALRQWGENRNSAIQLISLSQLQPE